ncbi:MAG: fucose isomerase [Bryobacteraceae bacterium]|jgi:L-fucose isomerase-like protein
MSNGNPGKVTFGLIVGNRGFFPSHLALSGRKEMIAAIEAAGHAAIALTPEATKCGAVTSRADVAACVDLFKKNRDSIGGIVVTLPNFGEERAIADAIRMAGLDVPVLIQATPDTPGRMTIADRRDSFCGKMSCCNNLKQYGVPYSLTTLHTEAPDSDCFRQDLDRFAAVCRIVRGLRGLRIGAIGARPAAFNTVRYSEKILEAAGISIEPIDLSEILGRINRMGDQDPAAVAKLDAIKRYVPTDGVPSPALLKMAKLGAVIDGWMKETEVAVSAVQCWTSLEEFFGVVPCTVMSMMSENLMSSACEVDICGVIGMHAMRLASGTPSALLDWNNNYGDDPDKAVCFHCSNLPKHFFKETRMDFQAIIAGTVGRENAYGTCVGVVKPGPMTFTRFSTNDCEGVIEGYTGQGEFTDDPLETFGGAGVVRIPRLQELLHFICDQGLEHHTAANLSSVAAAVHEASTRYLGWDVCRHS